MAQGNRRLYRGLGAFAFGMFFFATGCEDKEARQQVEDLQAELDRVKRTSMAMLDEKAGESEELMRRLKAAEEKVVETQTQLANASGASAARFQVFEKAVRMLESRQQEKERVSYLSPNAPGAASIQTAFGVFLLRLEGLAWDSERSSFVARIALGNLVGLSIHEFTLKGDFGTPPPTLLSGEAYEKFKERTAAWEAKLTPFEYTVKTDVTPQGWTRFEVPLPAKSETELQLIRVSMTIGRAHLAEQSEAKDIKNTCFVGVGQTQNMNTDYGTILVKFESVEPTETGSRVVLSIGNPLGLSIEECVLQGNYGPLRPEPLPGEAPEKLGLRRQEWAGKMKRFKTTISDRITTQRWTTISFVLPENDFVSVRSLALAMNIQKLHIPVARPLR